MKIITFIIFPDIVVYAHLYLSTTPRAVHGCFTFPHVRCPLTSVRARHVGAVLIVSDG